MAKRRKEKDDEEDKPFKLPKFDKEGFIKKERRNIKSMFIAFLFSALMAVICFGFFVLMGPETDMRWLLVLLVAIFSASFIKFFYMRLNIDTSEFTKKNWFVTYGVYFIAWLLILTILVNPPFYDDQDPRVELVVLPNAQEFGGDVKVIARITDNAGIEKSGITLSINNVEIDQDDFIFEDNFFEYIFESPENTSGDITYNYELSVEDISGRKYGPETGSFKFSNSTIRLSSHEQAYTYPGPSVSSGTPITFDTEDGIDIVYYTVNDGKRINVTYNEQGGNYITYPKFKGWVADQNVTLKVFAKAVNNYDFVMPTTPDPDFDISKYAYNNTIKDTQEYYFQVGSENIGIEDAPDAKEPPINYKQVPGFESVIFILALFAAILILRYKKKDKK